MSDSSEISKTTKICCFCGGLVFVSIACLAFFYHQTGSLSHVPAYASGVSLVAEPDRFDVGEPATDGEGQDVVSVNCSVRNISPDPVKLLGTSACCGTQLLNTLPSVIPPKGSQELTFRVHRNKKESHSSRTFEVFTDNAQTPRLNLIFSGRL